MFAARSNLLRTIRCKIATLTPCEVGNNVRFAPSSGLSHSVAPLPKCANKRHSGRVHFSFDDLVGATNERGWDSEPERLGGLQVDRKLDLRDLLHRQIGRLLAL